jgi:hypothetical protein
MHRTRLPSAVWRTNGAHFDGVTDNEALVNSQRNFAIR